MEYNEKLQQHIADENGELVPYEDFRWGDVEQAFAIHEYIKDYDKSWAVLAIGELLDWLYGQKGEHATGEKRRANAMTARLYAMLWCVRPELFDGITLRELADKTNISKTQLSAWVVSFTERFAFACRAARAHEAKEEMKQQNEGESGRDYATKGLICAPEDRGP